MRRLKNSSYVLIFCLTLGMIMIGGKSIIAKDDALVPPELNAYVDAPDDSYHWEIVEKRDAGSNRGWLLELTSQTWHGITWKHDMIIVAPQNLTTPDGAILFIQGGRIGPKPGNGDWWTANMLANSTGSYVAFLYQVPNQPLFDDLFEDALISETLVNAIAEKDATWPALFAMTKSAMRAMDAVQALLKQEQNTDVSKFVVTGASKRGWTTWLTAATGDQRVIAIAPIVIDTLNIQKQMQYQLETWGDWSASIHDYTDRELLDADPEKMDEFRKRLWAMVDPYYYRSRLTMPKLLVHGTNDPYWVVDAAQHYWSDLSEPKYILTLPNVGHDLGDQKLNGLNTLSVFAKFAFDGGTWPKVDWQCTENGSGNDDLKITSEIPIKSAKLWSAQSPTKEFRKAMWDSVDVSEIKSIDGVRQMELVIPKPQSGHVAFYVELISEFQGREFSLTTQVWRK